MRQTKKIVGEDGGGGGQTDDVSQVTRGSHQTF